MKAKEKPARKPRTPVRDFFSFRPEPEPERDALILALAHQADEALTTREMKAFLRILRASIAKRPKSTWTVRKWRRGRRMVEVFDVWDTRLLMDPEEKYQRAKALGFEGWESLERVARKYFGPAARTLSRENAANRH